jgi:hypothetical protein
MVSFALTSQSLKYSTYIITIDPMCNSECAKRSGAKLLFLGVFIFLRRVQDFLIVPLGAAQKAFLPQQLNPQSDI